MQQAAAIKTEQVKADRRRFEAQPPFVQNTLFQCVDEEVSRARSLSDIDARLQIAQTFKNAGNELFKRGEIYDANDKYERCLGCFWYISTSQPDWKHQGVKDEHHTYHEDLLDHDEVKSLVATALANIAACRIKLGEWAGCITACDHALRLSPACVKALYRRAQARTLPKSSGAAELDLAIADLRAALKLSPRDRAVRSMFDELRVSRERQRQADKHTFTGMFERGELVPETNDGDCSAGAGRARQGSRDEDEQRLESEVLFYKDMAQQMRAKGRDRDAAEIDKVVERAEAQIAARTALQPGSFQNPTPDMIRDAKENHGLDLTDPVVLKELQRMSAERAKGQRPATGIKGSKPESMPSTAKLDAGPSVLPWLFVAVAVGLCSAWVSPFFGY